MTTAKVKHPYSCWSPSGVQDNRGNPRRPQDGPRRLQDALQELMRYEQWYAHYNTQRGPQTVVKCGRCGAKSFLRSSKGIQNFTIQRNSKYIKSAQSNGSQRNAKTTATALKQRRAFQSKANHSKLQQRKATQTPFKIIQSSAKKSNLEEEITTRRDLS